MAADFAGAKQAIKDKFAAEWLDGDGNPRTRIVEVNKTPDKPWPPKDDKGKVLPYVLIDPEGTVSANRAGGTPGQQTYQDEGLISVHVFVPVGTGTADADTLAVAAGEIFRGKKFYDDVTPGAYVRSWTPRVAGGEPSDDKGVWWRVTATIPFSFWHLG